MTINVGNERENNLIEYFLFNSLIEIKIIKIKKKTIKNTCFKY